MKSKSRMFAPKARWICLLVVTCSSTGCWDRSTKQESGDQPAVNAVSSTAPSDQPSPKAADSASAKKSAAANPDEEFGFKSTWKPKSTSSAVPPPKPSASIASAASRPDAESDRYAELAASPSVGNQVEASKTPAYNPPARETKPPARDASPPVKEASAPTDPPSVDNPLRNPHPAEVNSRPKALPQPVTTSDAASAIADNLSTPVGPPSGKGSELVIQPAPNEKTAPQSTVPVTPVAPAAEKKSGSKEHSGDLAGKSPKTKKNSGVPFDPIKENGPIFVDWPKPKLALVITGNQQGYLEPCGCAGLDRMKGGMSRRYELFRLLRQKYEWPVVGIDLGNIAKERAFGKQAELKFQIAVNAMGEMHYSIATLGPTDLHLPAPELMALTMPADANKKTIFVVGNVGLFEFNESLLPRTQVITAGFKTIGITAVMGKTYLTQLANNADLKTADPEKLLSAAVPLLKSRANYLVLLAQTTRKEALDLANKFPDFDLVICSDGGAEPPNKAEEIRKGGTKLIEVGEKGMYAVVVGLFDNPQQPFRYQRVTLDSRFPASPEMIALMSAYQDQLKDLGLSGLGIRPLSNPVVKASNGDFVGTDACTHCHEESYRVWKKSPHSRAFATLKNAIPPRNFDPECVSCHTVGWHPTKYFPYQSGFLSEKETPKLINVGCENCHGPGEKHVWAEDHGTKAEQAAARKSVRITKEEAADPNSQKENCWSCHDLDNSPEFKFDLYWPHVKHYEHEDE